MHNVTYDPSKRYSWSPQDKFELTGEQFGTILNAVRAIAGTPEAQRMMAIIRANDAIEQMMVKAVEEGWVLEIPETKPQEMAGNLKIVK